MVQYVSANLCVGFPQLLWTLLLGVHSLEIVSICWHENPHTFMYCKFSSTSLRVLLYEEDKYTKFRSTNVLES